MAVSRRSLPDASAWALDPSVAYLNHRSFGATPVRVLAAQRAQRDALERNPVAFLVHQLPDLLAGVRSRIAEFLGADEDGLVFVDNATTGTQTVIAQARLAPGDEVLTTDHCYGAVLAQLRRATDAAGAVLRIVPVPLPAGGRRRWLRLSAQLYNTVADYVRLADALRPLTRSR